MGQQSVDRSDFGKSILLLATALGYDLDEAVIGVYWHALRSVEKDIRREAMARASVMEWPYRQHRFPAPGDLLTVAAEIVEQRRLEAAKRGQALIEACGCSPQGWQEIERDGVLRMARCHCWERQQQMIQDAGQPIQRPKLLPSSNDEVIA